MTKVFISHSSLDRKRVERDVIDLLKGKGVETWYAREDILTTAVWERRIKEGLKECEWFLVAVTPNAINSEWVHREVHWALERRPGKVIVVLLEPCDPADLHLGLDRLQRSDFTRDLAAGQKELLQVWGLEFEPPLGPGLRASMQIVGGHINYERNSWNQSALRLNVSVIGGVIKRDEAGKLTAYVKALHPFPSAQQMLERLGLDSFNLKSEDTVGSTDPARPTVLTDRRRMIVPADKGMTDFFTGSEVALTHDLIVESETNVAGVLDGQRFTGTFSVSAKYNVPLPPLMISGKFEVNLS